MDLFQKLLLQIIFEREERENFSLSRMFAVFADGCAHKRASSGDFYLSMTFVHQPLITEHSAQTLCRF